MQRDAMRHTDIGNMTLNVTPICFGIVKFVTRFPIWDTETHEARLARHLRIYSRHVQHCTAAQRTGKPALRHVKFQNHS